MSDVLKPRAMRDTFLQELHSLMAVEKDIFFVSGDFGSPVLDSIRSDFPDRFLNVGIAEQNLIGIATGLASEKYDVVTTTFAPFQTMRCCEQIKVNLGYMKYKVCMVGLASGLVLGTLGFTHCCIEDIGVLRSIPNITIISPSDSLETIKALQSAIKLDGPSYIRLTGGSNNSIINNEDYDFKIGKSINLCEGDDVFIFCNGAITKECLLAANELKKENIHCNVTNMHTIKPIDKEAILKASKTTNSRTSPTVAADNNVTLAPSVAVKSLPSTRRVPLRYTAISLILYPPRSLIKNIGFDGTGVHCLKTNVFQIKRKILKWG